MERAAETKGPLTSLAVEEGPGQEQQPRQQQEQPKQQPESSSEEAGLRPLEAGKAPTRACRVCASPKVCVARVGGGGLRCKACFCAEFEEEVWQFIISSSLLPRGSRVCVCVSGGKDSAVLLHVLHRLNRRQQQQWELLLLAVDEGIAGYRDHALETVQHNSLEYNLPLKVLSYKDLYQGWTMDQIHTTFQQQQQQQLHKSVGGHCSYCGVFRRQALERGARLWQADCLATGHNLEDSAETTLLNLIRGDAHRLFTSANPGSSSSSSKSGSSIRRCKPLLQCYQKEIVLYAHFNRLRHFATECTYSLGATRGKPRELLTALQAAGQPQRVRDIVRAATSWLSLLSQANKATNSSSSSNSDSSPSSSSGARESPACGSACKEEAEGQQQQQQQQQQARQQQRQQGGLLPCRKCGALTTNAVCRACTLVKLLQRNTAATAHLTSDQPEALT